MSSLRGEQALKDGLSFEFTWAARHLLEVMEERAEAIMLGGLPEEAGVDFRLYYTDHEEHHQVKRAFGTAGSWTLAALESENILSDFKERLLDDKVHCYMVSGIPAVQLGYLGDRARSSSDFAQFESSYLTAEYAKWFGDLVQRWHLPRDECWSRLRRVHAVPFDEPYITKCSHSLLRMLVVDGAGHAWTHLREFCLSHMHERVTSSQLWQWLRMKGIERQVVNNDPRILTRLRAQTDRYLNGVRRKLFKPQLPRQVSADVIKEMSDSTWGKDIVLLGSPGGGKSAVMLEIADAAIARGWPVLAFRLDDLSASLTPKGLQDELDLPAPPSTCLAHASAGAPALVIIDQLDAVSQYSGRTGSLFDRVADLVGELRAHRPRHPIHLVLACREADWKHDKRLPDLHSATKASPDEGVHTVQKLEESEIQQALASANLTLSMFTARQREQLLSRPQYLALIIDSSLDAQSITRIITPKHLFDAYWDKKQNDLSHEFEPLPGNPWYDILKSITDKLAETALALAPDSASVGEDDAPLAVMRRSLDRFPSRVVKWLIANGVLAEGNGRVRFGHESFFDYCFARFFEERNQSLHDYLVESDQTLIQRGQLRQVLAYQRGENPNTYLASVRALLESNQIRPHLTNLLATVVCEVPDPTEGEWQLIAPIIAKALRDFDDELTTSIACQVFMAFRISLPLFKMACVKGTFGEWFRSARAGGANQLFHVLRIQQPKAQEEVWTQIEPFTNDAHYRPQLDWLSHFCVASESRPTFEWLLTSMVKNRVLDEKDPGRLDRFYSLTEDLLNNRPEWLAEWLAAAIKVRAMSSSRCTGDILRSEDITAEKLRAAVEKAPRAFLEHVLPPLETATLSVSQHSFGPWSEYQIEVSGSGLSHISPDEALFKALVQALSHTLLADHTYGVKTLTEIRDAQSPALHRLHAAVLSQDNERCAPLVAEYLTDGGEAFIIHKRGRPRACDMISVHAARLSDEQLLAIETAVLECWPSSQNKLQGHYDTNSPKTCLGTYRGHQQMELLRAFPEARLSPAGRKRLAQWERKFDSLAVLYPPPRREVLLNKGAIAAWNPERFLQAIEARQKHTPVSWRAWSGRDVKIGSILREVVTQRPAEFIHFLSHCDANTPKAFLDEIESGLMNLEIDSELALEAARHFHRLGPAWAWRTIHLLEKVQPGPELREAFALGLEYARNGEGVKERPPAEEGKRGERLHSMASGCPRGQAIDAVARMLWADPDLLDELKPFLPAMIHDSCPAIRAQMAFICFAVAFKDDKQGFATWLFLQLVKDDLPDEHVLASYWPLRFLRAGLVEQWASFEPILIRMFDSSSSEVRSAASRLICIALVLGLPAAEMAQRCANSADPKVRAACAEILAHNLDAEHGRPWTFETLLKFADDADKDVCQAAGLGSGRAQETNFGPLSDFLMRYVRTRAFVRGAGQFLDALVESRSVLPATVFNILEVFIERLHEPVEEGAEQLAWHIDQVGALLIRLYHENRDGVLRRRALNLIDRLCVTGSISHDSLDQ